MTSSLFLFTTKTLVPWTLKVQCHFYNSFSSHSDLKFSILGYELGHAAIIVNDDYDSDSDFDVQSKKSWFVL